MENPANIKDYHKAKKVIQSLKKHGVIKGDWCTPEQSVNLWNAALEIVTGESIDVDTNHASPSDKL